ncbi:MAG: ATP-grasp domain-containing protein [Candidatus Omnitrophota bacterium]
MRKKTKVLLLFDSPYFTPRDYSFKEEFKDEDWKTEKHVYRALLSNGYKVRILGLYNDIFILLEELDDHRPDIVFNLTEVFNNKSQLDKNVAWFLEMLDIPYTGANPSNFLVCNNKALSKKILKFHDIRVPYFHSFYRGHKLKLPKKLSFPLIVKPLHEEASRGITQSSVVNNRNSLVKRIGYLHKKMNSDVIVEEYIDGREFYVSILGTKNIKVFPPIELRFSNAKKAKERIASYRVKWDKEYRKRLGIKGQYAGRIRKDILKKIEDISKKAYRALNIDSYARFDLRLAPSSKVYILEANANPCIAKDEDFSESAEKAKIPYNKLIKKIISLGFNRM